jgi:hypothetical protein
MDKLDPNYSAKWVSVKNQGFHGARDSLDDYRDDLAPMSWPGFIAGEA